MARILIADDDRDFVAQLTLVLQGAGHEVRAFPNGKEALVFLPSFAPDRIILDLRMAYTLDGLDTLRRIRQNPRFSHTPVLIASALRAQVEQMQKAAAEFDALTWVEKPVDIPALLEWVERPVST